MEEKDTTLDRLSNRFEVLQRWVMALVICTAFLCIFFLGMVVAIFKAGNAAGPRLLRMRHENDQLREENLRLRDDLATLRKAGGSRR